MSKITIYGYEGCRYCSSAKFLLTHHGIPFEDKDVKKDLEARNAWRALSDPSPTHVPQIVIDGELIGGFDQLNELFESPAYIQSLRP